MRRHCLGVTAALSFLGCAAAFPAYAAISINDVTVTEGQDAILTVSVDRADVRGQRTVSVQYATENDTAFAPSDYSEQRGTLNFDRRNLTQTISVPTIDDGTVEDGDPKTFHVVLSNANGTNIADDTGVVTILDNDVPPVGELITDPVTEQDLVNGGFRVLAANDLGMHCADIDYQIFSILPPLNVVHAQVIQRSGDPELVIPGHPAFNQMSLVYSAAHNPLDPVFETDHPTLPAGLNPPADALVGTARAAVSINSTSENDDVAGVFKTNFWTPLSDGDNPIGFETYDNLFFGLLSPAAIIPDTGLPVPDSVLLPGCLATPFHPDTGCAFGQQKMPGIAEPYVANDPEPFDRFDENFNFFSSVLPTPLGSVVQEVNWWAADGIPMLPVDDAGRINAYPLMRIQARNGGVAVASTDVVLPVASEADCQNCHATAIDCADPGLPSRIVNESCNESAISPTEFTGTTFTVATIESSPGDTVEQRLLNAAKLNILRLHDAKHGDDYPAGWGPVGNGCTDANDPDCLANLTPIQCSQCHYSPATDLAQLGPQTDPANEIYQVLDDGDTPRGSMSAMMHGHHGEFTDLFPTMPGPVGRNPVQTQQILEETCYQCHPGKRTQCLRGAMFAGGVVCQDCHGEMADVGSDFTTDGTRVPWASEPGCQSCHTGDVNNLNHPEGAIVADDGIRLLQAYTTDANAPIQSPDSRWAENESLYRLSGNEVTAADNQGHSGIMCEGCHGSTHAIWPVQPDAGPFVANDNVAANQLQGHAGTLIECTTCHADDLGNTLGGPHGLHPVGNTGFARGGHEDLAESQNGNRCRACHGDDGEGTVLSRMATDRELECDDETDFCPNGNSVLFRKGHEVGCTECHENEL